LIEQQNCPFWNVFCCLHAPSPLLAKLFREEI
jgi:hypothetical protein